MILVWRTGALGDTLLALPALAAIRAKYPRRRIAAAGNPTALAAAHWSGLVDDVIDATNPGLSVLSTGHPPSPDSLPQDIDLAVVWSQHHVDIARGLGLYGVDRVYGAPAIPSKRAPVASYYLETLAPLGASPVAFNLSPPAEAVRSTSSAWSEASGGAIGPIILLHPGTGSRLKRWPLNSYLALDTLLRAEGYQVVWTSGPADEEVSSSLQSRDEGRRLLPPGGVGELAAYAGRSAVVVSGDCGVAHLAALLGVPTVTLFGPTDHITWGPPNDRGVVLRLALPCSPCGQIAAYCPGRICLRALPVASVFAAVLAQLERRSATNAGTGHHAGPSRPRECHPPRPAPGPPGPLQVSNWGGAHTWATQLSLMQG